MTTISCSDWSTRLGDWSQEVCLVLPTRDKQNKQKLTKWYWDSHNLQPWKQSGCLLLVSSLHLLASRESAEQVLNNALFPLNLLHELQ